MDICIFNSNTNVNAQDYEVVERKGIGHPDTICDTLAEKISANYSLYTYQKYGHIFRHMIDKLSILGGKTKVYFGGGEFIKPIRILLNGRFTGNFCDEKIPYIDIATETIYKHMKFLFPMIDCKKNIEIIDNTHSSQGPGVVYKKDGTTNNERSSFFNIKNEAFMQYHNNMNRTNDTSTTVSFYPYTVLENVVLYVENQLNSEEFKKKYPFIGNDIKVMGTRIGKNIDITTCIPFISLYTPDKNFYKDNINFLKDFLVDILSKKYSDYSFNISINTRDNLENYDLYLTLTGSAVESGDEGAVGRGNRSCGFIPFCRNVSLEAPCGKNPVYHTGKLFTAIGNIISNRIYSQTGIENTVYLTSQMGGKIEEPWKIAIGLTNSPSISLELKNTIEDIVNEELKNHNKTTQDIILEKIKLY